MKNQIASIITIQNSMVADAGSTFSTAELDDLRCLVRLNTEFSEYLRSLETGQPWGPEWPSGLHNARLTAEYVADSIFAGVASFQSVAQAYRALVGTLPTEFTFGETLSLNIRQEYLTHYRQFFIETNFERRCRLVLDLFKLQILFAGLVYR